MAARKKNTWRVRGLDLRCSDDCLRRLLSEDDQGCADCTVHSLATEHHGHSQTATVSFTNGEATVAESLPPCTNHTGQYGSPALDDEFLGFTTLFAPPPEDHKIDIVAISGLGGHAFGSFKECGGEHMWLRDALPRHIVNQETGRPMARVLIYGYLSRVAASKSMQNVDDIAGPFREQLSGLTPPGAVARPVVFISHSLGGLVLKEAIISLAASSDADAERVRRTIYGLVFFGVPHAGMDNASLMTMAGKGPNRELVLSIGQTNSQFLTRQQRHFPGALETMGPQRREVFCFYETLESPTAVKTDGRWTMTGLSSILVSVTSATQCLLDTPDKQNHTCAIDRTHSEIVKFAAQDPWYDVVLQRLLRISRRAINESTAAAYHSSSDPAPGSSHMPLPTPKVTTLIPMRQNRRFTGRQSILEQLRDACFPKIQGDGQGKSHDTVALVGLGGMGKTQVALEFSYWVRQHRPDCSIFWISALSEEMFDQSCSEILRELGLTLDDTGGGQKRDVKQQLKDYLSRSHLAGKWLIVLDNVDDIDLVKGLRRHLPYSDEGITLITTRTEEVATMINSSTILVSISDMPMDEGRQLLEKSLNSSRVPDYSEESCARLLSALEALPLAITQAAAYLNGNHTSIRDYLGYLQGREEEAIQLLSFESNLSEHYPPEKQHHAVMRTWLVSLDEMRQRDERERGEGEEALSPTVQLLMFLSRIEPKAIPKSILPMVGRSMVVLDNTIRTLLGYTFLTKREGDVYDMHSLVHLAIRSWVSQEGLAHKATLNTLDLLERQMYFREATPWARVRWRAYMPHALRVLATSEVERAEARFWLAHDVSFCQGWDGRYDDALRWARVCSEGVTALYPEGSNEWLWAQRRLANACRHTGQLETALSLLEQVVSWLEQSRPATDELLVGAQLELGGALSGAGQHRRALQVVRLAAGAVSKGHPDWARIQSWLGHAYRHRQPERAIEHCERALARQKTLPPGDPNRLNTEHTLATAYFKSGQPQRALPLLQHVASVRQSTLSSQHPDLLTAQLDLALTYLQSGEPTDALPLLQHVVELRSPHLPPNGFGWPRSHRDLASAYLACAEVQEAVAVLEQLVKADDASTPPAKERLFWRDTLWLLQDVYEALGDQGNHSRLGIRIQELTQLLGSI